MEPPLQGSYQHKEEERIKALRIVGREPSGMFKGKWAGEKALGETQPLLSQGRK